MKTNPFLKGDSPDIMKTNMKSFKRSGMSELDATKSSMKAAQKHPNRHKNLKNFLHPKKGGK